MEAARRLCAEQPKATGSLNGSQRSKQQSTSNLHIIRLRGLPFSATPVDIKAFLSPTELPDGINSIQMVRHPDLRPTGEAYVHLSTETEVMQALNKHKQMMGKRYIEVRIWQFGSSCLQCHGRKADNRQHQGCEWLAQHGAAHMQHSAAPCGFSVRLQDRRACMAAAAACSVKFQPAKQEASSTRVVHW